jgi:hypothetical protein
MAKKLVLFEINECDFPYIFYGAKRYNFKAITEFFHDKKNISTFTKDKTEGVNLDPWVQWVSVHTGKPSSIHKVLKIGQKLDKDIPQVWESIAKKNYKIILWGAFNSILKNKKNINIFFPDPWSYTQKPYPLSFKNLLDLPRYYALNYPNINFFKFSLNVINFFKKIFLSKVFFYLSKNFLNYLKMIIKFKLKSFNYYFFLDLISLKFISIDIQKKNTDFAIIALNSFAHFQHNFWDEKKYEYAYFWYLNEMIIEMKKISKNFNSILIYNGFSQKKIDPIFYIRPKNPTHFFDILGIRFLDIKPNMTSGGHVFFANTNDKKKCIETLNNICLYGKKLFCIKNYNHENKIYYNFNLVFFKIPKNTKKINKNNCKKYFKTLIDHKTYQKTIKNDTVDKILDGVVFNKSTSDHTREGVLYYKNFSPILKIKKKKIENHVLSSYIKKYFNV